METTEPMRGSKVAEVRYGKDLFEVFTSADTRFPYAGYFNGKFSVSATHPAVALRGLERKHIIGLPEGKLIDFQAAAKRLRSPHE